MADYRLWEQSPTNKRYIRKNSDVFKYYADEIIPIDDLIKDNDLDNPIALNNHAETWSATGNEEDIHPEQFQYIATKDTNPSEIINGTRKIDGTVRINDGRHRIRALKNAGYTHVKIPVHHAIFDDDINDGLKDDYYNEKTTSYMLRKIANAIPYISQRSPEINKILVRMFKQKAGYSGK